MKSAILLFVVAAACLTGFFFVSLNRPRPALPQINQTSDFDNVPGIPGVVATGFSKVENGRTLDEVRFPDGHTEWAKEPLDPDR